MSRKIGQAATSFPMDFIRREQLQSGSSTEAGK
jgi:hypothetical protein